MAAPFVTGAAALLMEWGIVRGNAKNMFRANILTGTDIHTL